MLQVTHLFHVGAIYHTVSLQQVQNDVGIDQHFLSQLVWQHNIIHVKMEITFNKELHFFKIMFVFKL